MLLYLDPFSGIAGDMFLACLLDLGAPLEAAAAPVAELGVRLEAERVTRGPLAATRLRVEAPEDTVERHLSDLLALTARAGLSPRARAWAERAFEILAAAEAKVHASDPASVHFHEVGALDALADVLGSCAALDALGVEEVRSAPPTLGGPGLISCAHGTLPLPAPAVLHLLEGWPIRSFDCGRELTTPTGAALLRACAEPGSLPAGRLVRNGYGAGSADPAERPNVLRGVLFAAERASAREVVLLETNLDDLPGEQLADAAERLRAAGALDVWLVPVLMKKGRPGHVLSVLAEVGAVASLEACIFRHTSAFGLRKRTLAREVLARRTATVACEGGEVRVKLGSLGGEPLQAAPEYEDLRRVAEASGRTLRAVAQEALGKLAER